MVKGGAGLSFLPGIFTEGVVGEDVLGLLMCFRGGLLGLHSLSARVRNDFIFIDKI